MVVDAEYYVINRYIKNVDHSGQSHPPVHLKKCEFKHFKRYVLNKISLKVYIL